MPHVQLFAVTHNGVQPLPCPEGAESIHDVFDGLPLGVYSAFCTFEHNKFLCLEEHFDRTERSMALLGWQYRLDRDALRRALHEVTTAYPLPDARVRFDVLAEPASQLGTDSRVLIALSPFHPIPARYYREGVRVDLAPDLHRDRPQVKDACFVLQRRAYPLDRQAFEYLMLDDEGHILEGSSSNFYAVRAGVLWTAADGVLEGVARKIILQLAAAEGIPLRLEAVAATELAQLDEACLSSSSRGLIPIVNIGGQSIGNGRPGPITRQLMAVYRDFVAREVRPAIGTGFLQHCTSP